jgi:hypothetical protein
MGYAGVAHCQQKFPRRNNMRKKLGPSVFIALFAMPLLVVSTANAQESAPVSDRDLNIQAYVALLKTDVDSKREAIVKEIMQLDETQAKAFWPIYKEYDAERAKLDTTETQIFQEYAKAYPNVSNELADQLITRTFALEAQRIELEKKYYQKLKSATSAATAAKFIEVEQQLEDVAGLRAASVLSATPPSN